LTIDQLARKLIRWSEHGHDSEMVLKVPADAGELGPGLDADLPQVLARPDPAPQED
jgi:hypothetical protein